MFVDLFPWYFWVIFGILGSIYILQWVMTSTKGDPISCKILWFLIAIIGITVAADAMIKGTGCLAEYMPVIDFISKPLLILTAILFIIGIYQKSKYFDPNRRRTIRLLLLIFAISCTIFTLMVISITA